MFLVVIIEMISFHHMKKMMVMKYQDAAKQSVIAVAENTDYMLENIANQTNAILLNYDLMECLKNGNKKEFLTQLNSYFVAEPYIMGVYILNEHGYWYVGTEIYLGRNDFPKEQLNKTTGELKWLPTRTIYTKILSGVIPQSCFTLGRKIIDVNMLNMLGFMTVEVNEDALIDIYESIYEDGSEIFIVDEKGNMISNRNKAYIPNIQQLAKIKNKNKSGFIEYKNNEREYIAIYSYCNKNNWKIVKAMPKDLLYQQTERLQKEVLCFSFIGFIGVILMGYVYCEWITCPINKMMIQMKRVEQGNLSVKVDTKMNNELGSLGENFNQMVEHLEQLMKHIVQEERDKKELELEVLRAQINPHFLYNTLSTIRFMAKAKGEHSISDAVLALTKLLRVSISLGKERITLKEEIEYIEHYLLIQRLRFNQKFEFQYDIEEKYETILVPKLILQPIIENSLLYGIENIDEDNDEICLIISLHIEKIDNGIQIVIEDNGAGMEKEILENVFQERKSIERFSKVGLNNVNHRLKLYYGEEFGLKVQSKLGDGTTVFIRMKEETVEEKNSWEEQRCIKS